MPITFDQAYKEAIASARQDVAFTDTITIVLPTDRYTWNSVTTYRFARSDVDLQINGVAYQGRQFQYTLPELKANSGGALQITISDMAVELVPIIRKALESTDPITIMFISFFVNGALTSQANFEQSMEIKSISANNTDITISAGYPDTVNKKVPARLYTSQEFPGLRA